MNSCNETNSSNSDRRTADDVNQVTAEGDTVSGFLANEFTIRDCLQILKHSLNQLTADHMQASNDMVRVVFSSSKLDTAM